MKRAFIVMEPRMELSTGPILNRINKWRGFLEVSLWASPKIKRVSKSHQASIFSLGDSPSDNMAETWQVPVIEAENPSESVEHAYQQSIKLSQEWHLYGKLPELLQIGQVNVGQAVEGLMWFEFFPLFKQIELASRLLDKEDIEAVYVESDLFPSGQAFAAVATARGIRCRFLEPSFYRKAKCKIKAYRRHETRRTILKPANLYSIPQKNDDGLKYRVLADTPSYANYFNAVSPVIEELLVQNACKCCVIGEESHVCRKFRDVARVNIRYRDVTEYQEKIKRIRQYYHSELKKDAKFQSLFAYKGINIWGIIKEDIGYLFDKTLAELISNLASFLEVLKLVEPDILVVGLDETIAVRGHVLLAEKMGIPTLEVQHGMFSPVSIYARPVSSRIAAGGDYYKMLYMRAGVQEEQIVVTGWPKYDIYKKLEEATLKKDSIDILFATGPVNVKMNLAIIETIGQWAEGSKNTCLIVKPHPSENAKVYHPITRKYRNIVLYESSTDITTLTASSDALITEASTVGIEAALLDKPMVCVTMGTERRESLFVSSGVAIEAGSLAGLIPAIKDVLYNEEVRRRLGEARKRFVYEHAYLEDGQASKRVADLIIRMIEESRKNKKD